KRIVIAVIGLAKHSHANLDKSSAGLRVVKPQTLAVGHELLRRTGYRRAGTRDNVSPIIDKVVDTCIAALKPLRVIIVSREFKPSDHPRPIEPCSAIESRVPVRQIQSRANEPVSDFCLGSRTR